MAIGLANEFINAKRYEGPATFDAAWPQTTFALMLSVVQYADQEETVGSTI